MLKMPHSEESLRKMLSGAPVGSPVALLVGQKIIGHCLAAGLRPAMATPVVSHNLWRTHVALFFLTLQQTTAHTPQPSQIGCTPVPLLCPCCCLCTNVHTVGMLSTSCKICLPIVDSVHNQRHQYKNWVCPKTTAFLVMTKMSCDMYVD